MLAALLVGGCTREELAGPNSAVTPVTEIGLDGSATLELGDVLITTRLGQIRYLDVASPHRRGRQRSQPTLDDVSPVPERDR